jgi:hypothetical protein
MTTGFQFSLGLGYSLEGRRHSPRFPEVRFRDIGAARAEKRGRRGERSNG